MRPIVTCLLSVVSLAGTAAGQVRTPLLPTPVPVPTDVPRGFSILGNSPIAPAGYVANGSIASSALPQAGAPLPTGFGGAKAAEFGGRLYLFGAGSNFDETWLFDPNSPAWTRKASAPAGFFMGIGAAAANGRIYVLPQSSGVADPIYAYDPLTDAWTAKAPPPTARDGFAMAAVKDRIYVVGGETSGSFIDVVEEYDPVANSWRSRASLPKPKFLPCATAIGDRLFAAGGMADWSVTSDNCYAYDPAADRWTARASLPLPRIGGAMAGANGKVVCVGGGNSSISNPYSYVEEYDASTDRWSITTTILAPYSAITAAAIDGVVHVLTGDMSSNAPHWELVPTTVYYVFRKI